MLEAQQGDRISGKISRKQVASVAVAAPRSAPVADLGLLRHSRRK